MMYCLESNKGKEKETLEELLRVAIEYIVLAEPSYESGNEETKKRIKDLCCIDNLESTIKNLNLNVIKHQFFKVVTYNNNTAITIIKKKRKKIWIYCEAYFGPECFNLYPVIHNIPILNLNNAILCSKYETGNFV